MSLRNKKKDIYGCRGEFWYSLVNYISDLDHRVLATSSATPQRIKVKNLVLFDQDDDEDPVAPSYKIEMGYEMSSRMKQGNVITCSLPGVIGNLDGILCRVLME